MDLSELLKYYTERHKMVFTAFCVHIPMSYTVLYLYCSGFYAHDIYTKIMFTLSASIVFTFFAYLFSFMLRTLTNVFRRDRIAYPGIFEIMLPNILAFAYITLIYDPECISNKLFLIKGIMQAWSFLFLILILPHAFFVKVIDKKKNRGLDSHENE